MKKLIYIFILLQSLCYSLLIAGEPCEYLNVQINDTRYKIDDKHTKSKHGSTQLRDNELVAHQSTGYGPDISIQLINKNNSSDKLTLHAQQNFCALKAGEVTLDDNARVIDATVQNGSLSEGMPGLISINKISTENQIIPLYFASIGLGNLIAKSCGKILQKTTTGQYVYACPDSGNHDINIQFENSTSTCQLSFDKSWRLESNGINCPAGIDVHNVASKNTLVFTCTQNAYGINACPWIDTHDKNNNLTLMGYIFGAQQ